MKIIPKFVLKDGEILRTSFANTDINVRRQHNQYSRIGKVVFTNERMVCMPSSRLGGIKETIEIDFFDIVALRTKSDFESSAGLAVYTCNNIAIHFDFFRRHLRACELFMLLTAKSINLDSEVNAVRNRLRQCQIDACVPDDFRSIFPNVNWDIISYYGIKFEAGYSPSIAVSDFSKIPDCSPPRDKSGLDSKAVKTSETSYVYKLVQSLVKQGDYVTKDTRVFRIHVQGRVHEFITAQNDGYIDFLPFNKGEYYHSNERLFKINARSSNSKGNPNYPNTPHRDGVDVALRNHLAELENLIGLASVKEEIKQLISLLQIQHERTTFGLDNKAISRHMVFMGSPGTGKTTVARILGKIFKDLGLLSIGHFIEADRSALVAGFLGQTAIKTLEVLESAHGGILFIDEAYSLSNDSFHLDTFGHEAIDVLLKYMEDHRDDFVLITAGYDAPMNKFLDSNPGLKSRFNIYLNFPDYSETELMEIFLYTARQSGYEVETSASQVISFILSQVSIIKGPNFGNARAMRNLLEIAIKRQASRLISSKTRTKTDLCTLTHEDFSTEDAARITI